MVYIYVLLAVLGLGLLIHSLLVFKSFNRYCYQVALERGEVSELNSPFGGDDNGLNGYKTRIYEDLLGSVVDEKLSEQLIADGAAVRERLIRLKRLSIAYVAVLCAVLALKP